jgi:hypothetical protein
VVAVKTYQVNVERDGKFWLIHVPEVDRSTQARNLAELDSMARDLIAIMADIDPESFDVNYAVHVSDEVTTHLQQVHKLREIAATANAGAASELRAAARHLVQVDGLTVRDVGRMLGVSHQRVHQLVHDETTLVPIRARAAASRERTGLLVDAQ